MPKIILILVGLGEQLVCIAQTKQKKGIKECTCSALAHVLNNHFWACQVIYLRTARFTSLKQLCSKLRILFRISHLNGNRVAWPRSREIVLQQSNVIPHGMTTNSSLDHETRTHRMTASDGFPRTSQVSPWTSLDQSAARIVVRSFTITTHDREFYDDEYQ